MGDGLTAEEVRAFAAVFADEVSASHVLAVAGFPADRRPWNASNALLFWVSVSRLLWDGVVGDGRGRLLAAAGGLFPANPVFAAGPVAARPAGGEPVVPVAWNVPGRPVRFVGREGLLDGVHERLSGSARVALVALDGMGGVGKTAIALEYAPVRGGP